MKKMKYGILALLACSTMTLTGCFTLDEEPFSEITEESFIPTQQDAAALMEQVNANAPADAMPQAEIPAE